MTQLFSKRDTTLFRGAIVGAVLLICSLGGVTLAVWWSPYMTYQNVTIDQPVPFSHEHHVGGLGIDCRYCHTSVEISPSAGLPATEICMTCHSQIWTEAPVLAPVRESWRTGKPMVWSRVHALPDFAYFNHSIHVAKGVACITCHGPVNEMPLTYRAQTLYMKWCLECHRAPEKFVGPQANVFSTKPADVTTEEGLRLLQQYRIHPAQMTDCSVCHR